MSIPQNVKDWIDIAGFALTVLTLMGVAIGWILTRHDNKQKGAVAMAQINLLATNHFPHMAEDIRIVKDETKETNKILTELRLGQVETNTILRMPRTSVTTQL